MRRNIKIEKVLKNKGLVGYNYFGKLYKLDMEIEDKELMMLKITDAGYEFEKMSYGIANWLKRQTHFDEEVKDKTYMRLIKILLQEKDLLERYLILSLALSVTEKEILKMDPEKFKELEEKWNIENGK